MYCSEAARDDSAPWSTLTPPTAPPHPHPDRRGCSWLTLVVFWISVSTSIDHAHADRKWTSEEEEEQLRRRCCHLRSYVAREEKRSWIKKHNSRLSKRRGGVGDGGPTNSERAYEKLENGAGNYGPVNRRSWKSDKRATGVASIVGISCSASAPVVMESSGSSTSSRTGGEASTSGGASGAGAAAPPPPGGGKSGKKTCGVCGDRAKSYHFGGVSCDSCKAFFRRSVQNDAYKNFQCPYERRCDINVNSRKCCQYCRFHKCLLIGMETGWVMSEEERLQLLRQRMERKAKQPSRGAPPPAAAVGAAGVVPEDVQPDRPATPDRASLEVALGHRQAEMLYELVDNYATSLREVPYVAPSTSSASGSPSSLDIVSMFSRTFERLTHFAGSTRAFQRVCRADRATLLRCGMIEACLIRAAFAYDPHRDCWPDTGRPEYQGSPCLRASDLRHLASPELRAAHARFNSALHAMRLDERSLMTLLMVALFSPDRPTLQRPAEVQRTQESYAALLRRYLNIRYGAAAGRKLFAELLLKLPDLRQLNDAFTQSRLRLSQGDIAQFQHRYGALLTPPEPGQLDVQERAASGGRGRQRRRSDGDGSGGDVDGAAISGFARSAPPSPGSSASFSTFSPLRPSSAFDAPISVLGSSSSAPHSTPFSASGAPTSGSFLWLHPRSSSIYKASASGSGWSLRYRPRPSSAFEASTSRSSSPSPHPRPSSAFEAPTSGSPTLYHPPSYSALDTSISGSSSSFHHRPLPSSTFDASASGPSWLYPQRSVFPDSPSPSSGHPRTTSGLGLSWHHLRPSSSTILASGSTFYAPSPPLHRPFLSIIGPSSTAPLPSTSAAATPFPFPPASYTSSVPLLSTVATAPLRGNLIPQCWLPTSGTFWRPRLETEPEEEEEEMPENGTGKAT